MKGQPLFLNSRNTQGKMSFFTGWQVSPKELKEIEVKIIVKPWFLSSFDFPFRFIIVNCMKLILVIEDNEEVRENTAELLELSGYKVLTAKNGKTGFEKTRSMRPDVVICDVLMPETDGLGFLHLAKNDKTTSTIPLIFFSAGSAPAAVRKNIEQGADVYLRKPFSFNDLLGAVEKCLNRKTG